MRIGIALLFTGLAQFCHAGVVATWLFDEQTQAYPSTVLSDAGPNKYVIALGRGARLVPGRFGNALEIAEPDKLEIRGKSVQPGAEGAIRFGLVPAPTPTGRKVQPLWWGNATFAVLMTSGEKHLRTPGYANATNTKLNLGAFDWTVEFWYQPASGTTGGVVFELGSGPRGENDQVTRLSLDAGRQAFELVNQPSGTTLKIPTDKQALAGGAWRHLAFVYAAGEGQLRHYVDGKLQTLPANAKLAVLPHGDEGYFTIGRDGLWARPLAGKIDEMRFSDNRVYTAAFTPPASFSIIYGGKMPKVTLKAGPPLLFGKTVPAQRVIDLGLRKHVFIDDAMVAKFEGITWVPNPPKRMEKVADEVRGHLTMVEDETGLLRLYYRGPDDYLAVMTSRDGVHWEKPDTGHGLIKGERNIVLPQPVGLGCVLIDPNGPPETRYKYVSGTRYRSLYLFTSKDGFWFEQSETAVLPFAAGSQSALYYDDQRQVYVAHHRSDYGETPGGTTQRRFVMSEVKNLFEPWPFEHITPEKTREASKTMKLHSNSLDPWFLDNGPLASAGFGIDLPTIMATDDKIDPVGTDIYVTKAQKYQWAPDTYVAFPAVYFHYHDDGPATRQALGTKERGRGSGVVETQIAVSRDGLDWKRYPRPAYVGLGGDGSNAEHMLYMTHGMVKRDNELWQFVGGHGGSGTGYHSPFGKEKPAPLYRYVQRLDGFIAAEAAYTGGTFTTKPFRFDGNRLELNINTGAVGYAQIGFLDENGKPIPGYAVDDCVYINGDFLSEPVEWLGSGKDVSKLAGKTVQLVFRMRSAKLFAMQFTKAGR
jgi:hypothetical protein